MPERTIQLRCRANSATARAKAMVTPRPKLGPGYGLHAHSTTGAMHPTRPIAEHHRQMTDGKISPTACLLGLVNLPASPSANSTTQSSGTETVNLHHDLFWALSHCGHVMSFQTEQFPDKGFYQHLVSTSSTWFFVEQRKVTDSGCFLPPTRFVTYCIFSPSTSSHFSERRRKSWLAFSARRIIRDIKQSGKTLED